MDELSRSDEVAQTTASPLRVLIQKARSLALEHDPALVAL
jgi:hypothetical protein